MGPRKSPSSRYGHTLRHLDSPWRFNVICRRRRLPRHSLPCLLIRPRLWDLGSSCRRHLTCFLGSRAQADRCCRDHFGSPFPYPAGMSPLFRGQVYRGDMRQGSCRNSRSFRMSMFWGCPLNRAATIDDRWRYSSKALAYACCPVMFRSFQT